jgi:hypothetical protein
MGGAGGAGGASAWSALASQTTEPLRSIDGRAELPGVPQGLTAVGDHGTIVRTVNFSNWNPVTDAGVATAQLTAINQISLGWQALVGRGGKMFLFGPVPPSSTFSWREVSTGTTADLLAVYQTTSHAYVFGDSGTALRFEIDSSLPDRATIRITGQAAPSLHAVDGYSADNGRVLLWVVGAGGAIYHYDSNAGALSPEPASATSDLNGIYVHHDLVSGARSLWAVGAGGTILHSTGDGTWTPETSGTTRELHGVFGVLASQLIAVGEQGTILYSTGDGSWSAEASGTTATLWGGKIVVGSSGFRHYVVGDGGTLLFR